MSSQVGDANDSRAKALISKPAGPLRVGHFTTSYDLQFLSWNSSPSDRKPIKYCGDALCPIGLKGSGLQYRWPCRSAVSIERILLGMLSDGMGPVCEKACSLPN